MYCPHVNVNVVGRWLLAKTFGRTNLGSPTADNLAHPYNRRRVLTIDDLPDDDLLEIFNFYVVKYQELVCLVVGGGTKREIESWQSLVHVCRRWRGLVFGSPRRLNLKLYCTSGRSARKSLDVWPGLPLLILGNVCGLPKTSVLVDDVAAGLEHSDHICQINLKWDKLSQIEKLRTAMQMPFPGLTVLNLSLEDQLCSGWPVLPDSFLGGSAPRLRYFHLNAIAFPGLPKLILSATHLVNLYLFGIPHSGYISPEAMVTCLSILTNLKEFRLSFRSPRSYPDLKSRHPPPPTRSVLPTLTIFCFNGMSEYLEEFVARIDAPQLYQLSTALINAIDFKISELNQFVSRTPTLGACDEARLVFFDLHARVRLLQSHAKPSDRRIVEVSILSHPQLLTLAHICTLPLRLFSTMETLYIDGGLSLPLQWEDGMENTKWLELLLPFTAVKNLYLSETYSQRIALALQELTGGRTTEVLPALQNVILERFRVQPSEPAIEEGIAQFISARQLTNHPVAISVWHRDRGTVWDMWYD